MGFIVNQNIRYVERSYPTLLDGLGQIGGLYELMDIFLIFFVGIFSSHLFTLEKVNQAERSLDSYSQDNNNDNRSNALNDKSESLSNVSQSRANNQNSNTFNPKSISSIREMPPQANTRNFNYWDNILFKFGLGGNIISRIFRKKIMHDDFVKKQKEFDDKINKIKSDLNFDFII